MAGAESIRRSAVVGQAATRPVDATAPIAPGANAGRAHPIELRALFDAHYASVWRLLRRLGVDAVRVDDAAQDVFWVAARHLTDINPGREYAFLYGVALRVASDARRQQASAPMSSPDELGVVADDRPSPEEQVDRKRTRELLDLVLDKMSPELRAVFVLFEFEGVEVREIAAIHEIPVGTAGSRLRRAREEFSRIAKRLHATLCSQEDRSR